MILIRCYYLVSKICLLMVFRVRNLVQWNHNKCFVTCYGCYSLDICGLHFEMLSTAIKNTLSLHSFKSTSLVCWQPLDKPDLCCQWGARPGMRLAKAVVWEKAVKVSCNQSLTWSTLELSWPRQITKHLQLKYYSNIREY